MPQADERRPRLPELFVVDASSIVRAALNERSAAATLLDAILDLGLLVSSPTILDEVEDVLSRPKFQKWRSAISLSRLVLRLRLTARLVVPDVTVRACRDRSDDKYLETALAALSRDTLHQVTLVSDDKDLLVLDPWREGIRILKPEAALLKLTDAA